MGNRPELQEILSSFIPVLVAMDPFGQVPFFLGLAGDLDRAKQRRLLRDTALAAGVLGTIFAISGLWIFKTMGMTLSDFKIGGGLVFMIIAIRIILGLDELGPQTSSRELAGVVPLATPGIVGPAVIANIVLLSQQKGILFSLVIFFVNLLFTLGLLYNAAHIERLMGQKGTRAVSKVFAILLAGLAVMFIREGLYTTLADFSRRSGAPFN